MPETRRLGRLGRSVALLCFVAASAGCSPASAPGSGAGPAAVHVQPASSLEDDPVHIVITGLAAGEMVATALRSTDAKGVTWTSSATFKANATGQIDLDRSPPVSGDYSGVAGMGLVWSLRSPSSATQTAYFWNGAAPLSFTLSVTENGSTVAATTFQRRLSPVQLTTRLASLASDGFVGEFYSPASTVNHPAVLVIGGSEGGPGPTLLAGLLAAHGYPSLSVAYFNEPGLPSRLSRIPLEYFETALTWLAKQPGVDPGRIVVVGISRGSEAALLLGTNAPAHVHGVIASVPSNVALCSFPGCDGPAWTLHGEAVPYTTEFDNPRPSDNPEAVIPVERIKGPILAVCGGRDSVWSSCAYAEAIMSRLDRAGELYIHQLYAYPDAGHGAGELVPYEPHAQAGAAVGASPDANPRAVEQLWPRVLAFLQGVG
jgi:dienelactone hydrolase